MARGPSGRLVVELKPDLKHQLYSSLAREGLTFKDWLTGQAERYIADTIQPQLLAAEPPPPLYGKPPASKNG